MTITICVEQYARHRTKFEGEELDNLSEWIESIRKLLKSKYHNLTVKMRTDYASVFNKPDVIKKLHRLYEKFVQVPADKASNDITCIYVCNSYDCKCQ
jgi:hypothetical protein